MSNSGDNPIIGDDGENAIFNAGVQTTPPREEDGRGIPPPVIVNQPPPVQPGASSGGWPLLGPRLHPDRADSRQPPPQVYPGALNDTNNPIYIPSLRRQPQPSYGYQFDRGLPPRGQLPADTVLNNHNPPADSQRHQQGLTTSDSDGSLQSRDSGKRVRRQRSPRHHLEGSNLRRGRPRGDRSRRSRRSRSSSSISSALSRRRGGASRHHRHGIHGLTSGVYYVPSQRGHTTSNWCYGCKRRHCENPISVKDFDTMQNVIRTLRPDTTFEGAKDSRSGTTWISVMYHETEGHPDVVRYLWLKKYTSCRVWKEITGGLTPPSRCYQDHERQVDKILKQFRRTFDTDEHLHKTEHLFNNCVQGNDSVYAFVERLEDLSSELYHLGSPVLEYKMKWKLYNGLKGAELRLRVNDYLDDKEIDYMEFKEVVLRQHRRMTNVNEADNNTKPSDKKTRDDSRGSYGRRSDDSGYRSRRPWQQRPPYPRRESVNPVDDSGGYTTDDNEVRQHHVNMGRDLSGLKCYRCLKRGHSAKDCEQPEPADLSTRCRICGNPQHQAATCKIKSDKLVCHRCNNPGHLAYVCTSKTPTSSPTTGKRQSTPRSTARVQVIIDNDRLQEHPQQRVCTTSSSSDRDTSRTTKPMVMVIGNVCIEDNVIPALFDTGAEVSLITRQALQRLAPHVDVYTNTPRHISVADGGTLHVDGTVMLKVSTNRITVHDEFIVVSDDLSVPILLGCPTLGKLRTTIRVSPHGMHVTTNDDHDFSPYSAPKEVRFNDNVSTYDKLLEKDQEDITVTYTINHVRRLFLHQGSHSGLSDVELYNALFPTTRIYPDDLFVGQADCNQSGKDPTSSNYYVHYMSTDPTETSSNVESATPHHDENNDKEDVDHDSDDNLPPWDVLQRHWMWDATTPLGRACVRLPWLGEERPPNNFKNAAHRGAASTRRLSPEQRQAFEAALQVYTTRGFCAIVKDNYVNGNLDHPTFDECQAAWDAMTRDTALDGTVVIKPYHYTPSYMVFRDSHPTTPCRIVLDFRTLNKFTRRGGKTQNDLQGVLLQLRSFPYFISADVSKAFCQMKASLYDVGYSSYTCVGNYTVLWSSIAFGSNNAPCMLEASSHDVVLELEQLLTSTLSVQRQTRATSSSPRLLSNAQIEQALLMPSATGVEYIRRGPAIPTKMLLLKYVDDLYYGGRSKEEARLGYEFGSHVFTGHGFGNDPVKSFCNWLVADGDEDVKKSVLGYLLKLDVDKFHAVYSGHVPDGQVTKLQACAALASLYDPLGLYVELDIQGRLLWREVCQTYKSWDDTLKEDLVHRIKAWATSCTEITTSIGFERFIDLENYPLLVSSDASGESWGVDVRCTTGEGTTTRVMARGGVFPSSQSKWSIPRKELVALYHALTWIRSTSAYLPVKTCLRPHQSPLEPLVPNLPARQVTLLCDSEITVYRLRRPGKDKKLPIVERRRLKEIREMCRQLDVIVKHIPSELNYADSISRAKFNDKSIDGAHVCKAVSVSEVVFDYRETTSDEAAEDIAKTNDEDPCQRLTTSPVANATNTSTTTTTGREGQNVTTSPVANATNTSTTTIIAGEAENVTTSPVANATNNSPTTKALVMTLNCDGIDLPDYNTFTTEQQEELRELSRYAKPVEEVESELLQDGNYHRRLSTCVLRAQKLDDDLTDFKNLLLEKVTYQELGMKGGKLRRLARICYVDQHGIVRRHPSPERLRHIEEDDNGVIYLGNSKYTSALLRVLSTIYHYKYLHLGSRRVCHLLQRRFYCKKMSRLVRSTLRSCTSCIKARATRQLNYVTNHVQDLLTTGLWQLVGIDVAGPYDKATRLNDKKTNGGDPCYILLVQDYVSGFTAARPLHDVKAKTVADAIHGVFCEHGSPSVVLSDHDRTSLTSRQVRRVLQRHGTKHYVLPGYGQYLSFWERSHKDMADVVKAIRESRHLTERSHIEDSFINDYLLSVRAYNTTPRGWANVSPSELHYVYKSRLPGDQEGLTDVVDWESLRLKHTDVDTIKVLRDTIPMVDAIKQRTAATLNDYLDYWRLKQERLLERYARDLATLAAELLEV